MHGEACNLHGSHAVRRRTATDPRCDAAGPRLAVAGFGGTTVKKLEAILKPALLDVVKLVLSDLGVDGMTSTEVKQHSFRAPRTTTYRGTEYVVDFVSAVKIEVLVHDTDVARIAAAVEDAIAGDGGDVRVLTVERRSRARGGGGPDPGQPGRRAVVLSLGRRPQP